VLQAATGKKTDLKTLGRKVHPMEDLFRQFKGWLEGTNDTLDKLSPAASEQSEREQQLQKAKVHVDQFNVSLLSSPLLSSPNLFSAIKKERNIVSISLLGCDCRRRQPQRRFEEA
jgi:hypothetical protein